MADGSSSQDSETRHNSKGAASSSAATASEIGGGEQLLPIANVGRIMKQILPANAKISKEAKETMQECASEFIGFATSEACHKCNEERGKTVYGDHICSAFGTLGFDSYADPMKRYLHKYRGYESERASSAAPDALAGHDNDDDHHFRMNPARNVVRSSIAIDGKPSQPLIDGGGHLSSTKQT